MSRKGRSQARRRRGVFLTKAGIVATIVAALVGVLSWHSQTQATDREHESRKAREVREEYKELDTEVGRYVKGAKLVYRASYQQWRATGRWPRGEDH
jgi:hypothetical protein